MPRRRSIYETGAYETPLADLIEKIPDYFMQWEMLKQGEAERKEAKTFRDKQYSDALIQQGTNNLFRQQQANYKKVNDAYNRQIKQIDNMNISSDITARLYSDLNKQAKFGLLGIDDTAMSAHQGEMDKLKVQWTGFQVESRDISDMSDTDKFDNYGRIESLRDNMDNAEGDYDNTTWEKEYDVIRNSLSTTIADLSNKAGKPKGEKFYTLKDKKLIYGLNTSIGNARTKRDDTEAALSLYIADTYPRSFNNEGIIPRTEQVIKRMQLDESIQSFKSKTNFYNKRLGEYDEKISAIQNKPEYRYPSITTSAELIEMSNVAKEQTKWVMEDATDFHLYFPDERLKLLGDEPVTAEEFEDMKTRYEKAKDDEKFMTMLDEELDEDEGAETEEIPANIPKAWTVPATEPMPEKGITDEDVDVVLADVRETTGFYPEGDAPKEPEPKPKPIVPIVAEPLTARGEVEIEEVVAEEEKKLAEATLFKEPVKVEDLKNMNIKDSKGESIKFESVRKFDEQINSMYNEIRKIGYLAQSGISREKRAEMKESQRKIAENLIKTLDILNISKNASIKDRNLKSTMNQFLKNKKFKDSDALIKFLENYI